LKCKLQRKKPESGRPSFKASKIDLVLSDGKESYMEVVDTLATQQQSTATKMNNNIDTTEDLENELFEHYKI
jgi:D-ribose pyranose/furanose isomerase RbsD